MKIKKTAVLFKSYIIFLFLSLGAIYELILRLITLEKTIKIKKLIRNSIVINFINIANINENEFQNPSETVQNNNNIGEIGIAVHNNKNRINLKDNNLNNNQIDNESNRNSERENVNGLTNSKLNEDM